MSRSRRMEWLPSSLHVSLYTSLKTIQKNRKDYTGLVCNVKGVQMPPNCPQLPLTAPNCMGERSADASFR
jgi:hypothetical protein